VREVEEECCCSKSWRVGIISAKDWEGGGRRKD